MLLLFLCWKGGKCNDTWQRALIEYHSAGHLVNPTLARCTHILRHAVLQGVVKLVWILKTLTPHNHFCPYSASSRHILNVCFIAQELSCTISNPLHIFYMFLGRLSVPPSVHPVIDNMVSLEWLLGIFFKLGTNIHLVSSDRND